jgi:hypothetical protein
MRAIEFNSWDPIGQGDLLCSCCSRVLLPSFWTLVAQAGEHLFSRLSLKCDCGHQNELELARFEPVRRPPPQANQIC